MIFSVIIPVYNQQEFLNDAIDSVLSQTFVDFELIIVDDGSTDNSLNIAMSYEDERIKVVHQVNKGLASARNTGIMNAKGEWCVFLDSDDMLAPNYLEKVSEVLEENDIVAPSLKEFGLSNATVILMPNPKLEDFRPGNRVGYCQAIRKTALVSVGGYSPRMEEGYEDLHLTCNLLVAGYKLVTLPDVLWLYRLREGSMISKSKLHHDKLLAQINKDFPEAKLDFRP